MPLPDLFVVGAPKAGTTALHAALAGHPGLHMSPVKEPKFYLCDERPPPKQGGPGDNHSLREWVWHRDRYEALFEYARPGALKGESTPFYLWSRAAQRRIAQEIPDARFVAIVRDPVDRAYSNWTHLWSDGLEPVGDFLEACDLEPERAAAGWAPFWRYRGLGRYGQQIEHLLTLFPAGPGPRAPLPRHGRRSGRHARPHRQVPRDRPRGLPRPAGAVGERVDLGRADAGQPGAPPGRAHRGVDRASSPRPSLWRTASKPAAEGAAGPRQLSAPTSPPEQRTAVLAPLVDDVRLLHRLTGIDVDDWLDSGRRGARTPSGGRERRRPGSPRSRGGGRRRAARRCSGSGGRRARAVSDAAGASPTGVNTPLPLAAATPVRSSQFSSKVARPS